MANANYSNLRSLFEKYKSEGFEIIAFPVNQFGCQGPLGSKGERDRAIEKFSIRDAEFTVYDEIAVKDKGVQCKVRGGVDDEMIVDSITLGPPHPLCAYLKAQIGNEDIPWN